MSDDLKQRIRKSLQPTLNRLSDLAMLTAGADAQAHHIRNKEMLLDSFPDAVIDAIHEAGFAIVPRSSDFPVMVTHSHPNGVEWRDLWRVDLSLDGGKTAHWAEQEVQSPLMQHTAPDRFKNELTGWLVERLADELRKHIEIQLLAPVRRAVEAEDQRRRETDTKHAN